MKKCFQILSMEDVWNGFLKLKHFRVQHECFAGGWCPQIQRERVEGKHAVSVLLYDPQADTVVLIEQFRIGALGHANDPWLLETVGGYCEEGESTETVARRETLEETGCELLDMEFIGSFFTTPGWCGERISLYCGRVDSSGAGGVHGLDEEGEDILVDVMPFEEAFGQLFRRANSTSIIVGLQWLQQHRAELQQRWRK
ncbi:NUDIX domain-containing protein [Thiolapillus sp.]